MISINNFYILFVCITVEITLGFKIYWNVPTRQCKNHYGMDFPSLLRTYGILVNEGDAFQGDKITIFYESQLGLYPRFHNGAAENDGLPQLGNIDKHLEKAAQDIDKVISNVNFDGLGVIDWEAWRPVYSFNWGTTMKIYKEKSVQLVKQNNSNLQRNLINIEAEKQFENSSKTWMLKTIELAKQLRPKARWCYYLFPDCYNYVGNSPDEFKCSDNIVKGNNKLSWLWETSTAICPSIYLHESALYDRSLNQRIWEVNGKLKEAIRVASPNAKIFPYVNYYLSHEGHMIPQDEFWRLIAQVASFGLDGAVIWGPSKSLYSKDDCMKLESYITDTIGPAVEKVMWNYHLCSKDVCNNSGSCTWVNEPLVTAWKLYTEDINSFDSENITCRCFKNYGGKFCEELNSIL